MGAAANPAKVHLVNVTTGEGIDVLINPTQLQQAVSVNYARQQVPGMSHQPLQYISTGNRVVGPVQFQMDRLVAEATQDSPEILDFQQFIEALTVPAAGTGGPADTRPPRVLIVWPGVMTVEAVVTSADFLFIDFGEDASALAYVANVTFEEALDVRRTSQQLRRGVL